MEKNNEYFILGIKGVGMASLAIILKTMGLNVWGADVKKKFITDKYLNNLNIKIVDFSVAKKNINRKMICIYSAAHQGYSNSIIQRAVKKGCTIYNQSQFVQILSTFFDRSIAVSGSHGKTTTTALISYCLKEISKDIGYLYGTSNGGFFSGYKFFIYEADEYAVDPPRDKTPKILSYMPDYLILTNIDYDHPDVYKDLDQIKSTYKKWIEEIRKNKPNFKLIANGDDYNVLDIVRNLPKKSVYLVGYSKTNDYILEGNSIKRLNKSIFSINTKLVGRHNMLNSALVYVLLYSLLGFDRDRIEELFANFINIKRRLEKIFENDNYMLYDDYAHHPEEILKTLIGLRESFPDKKIHLIFQPHTYSRTKALYKEFINVFKKSDFIYLLPIFASAREKKGDINISSTQMVTDSKTKSVYYVKDGIELKKVLSLNLNKNDLIITMGAGDVYKHHKLIIRLLKQL